MDNRNTLFLALILIALGAVALLESSALVILVLLGLLFLVRQFDNANVQSSYNYDYSYDYDYEDDDEYARTARLSSSNQPRSSEQKVYRHALEAVTRAGLDPDDVQLLAVDIGLMSFKGTDSPEIFRTWSLPDDVDYVQPFVELRLPTEATGVVRFEIVDGGGEAHYVHEDNFKLERGRNLVTPNTRLPIHDQFEMDGKWTLRVSADGVVLAEHLFAFAEATEEAIRRHIGEDGEINTEMRAALSENRLPKMSLDDLLSFQDEDEAQQAQQ